MWRYITFWTQYITVNTILSILQELNPGIIESEILTIHLVMAGPYTINNKTTTKTETPTNL